MIPDSSRYSAVGRARAPHPSGETGRTVVYMRRRLLPQGSTMPALQEVTVIEGDRLDLIAYRTLGDPEQAWRICDANDAMDPDELAAVPGRRLRIPAPEPGVSSPFAPDPDAPDDSLEIG